MKKIKIIAFAALSIGAIAGLASCERDYGEVGTEINVWAPAEEKPVIEAIVKDYNEKQQEEANKFNVKITAVSEADGGATLTKDPQVKDYPSLIACADDHINNLVTKNIALELKGEYLNDVKEYNLEAAVTGATNGEGVYGFPITADNGYFLWYDNSALEAKDVASLEGLLEKAHTLNKKVLMDVPNGWYANSFIMSPQACGTQSLKWVKGEKGVSYETNWDNEVGVKVSKYIATLLTEYTQNGTLVKGGNPEIAGGFEDGSMIAAVSGTWMEAELSESIGEHLAASKLPEYHIEDKAYQMTSFLGSKLYVINKTAKVAEQKTAAALASLLTNKDSQLKRFEVRKSIPSNKEALKAEEYINNVSIGGKALNEQHAIASCVQSQTAEDRYWDIGKAIGQAYIDSNLGEFEEDWGAFLKGQCNILRTIQ